MRADTIRSADAAVGDNAAPAVVLVRPAAFGHNPETASSNAFQREAGRPPAEVRREALQELDGLRRRLEAEGVRVFSWEDTPDPPKPDAVFPNNWVSFHADGSALVYPLLSPARRQEVRVELLDELRDRHRVEIARVVDLRTRLEPHEVLEGTGSLVLDRMHGVAFACRSPRTTEAGLRAFAAETGYDVLAYDSVDGGGVPHYHTNVPLALGTEVVLVALEAIRDDDQRARVSVALRRGGRALVELSHAEVAAFAGNVLEVRANDGEPLLVMSERARASFPTQSLRRLERHVRILAVPFDTIETVGGGGVRCALAAMHCPLGRPA